MQLGEHSAHRGSLDPSELGLAGGHIPLRRPLNLRDLAGVGEREPEAVGMGREDGRAAAGRLSEHGQLRQSTGAGDGVTGQLLRIARETDVKKLPSGVRREHFQAEVEPERDAALARFAGR